MGIVAGKFVLGDIEMKASKAGSVTKAQLKRQVLELRAQLPTSYECAKSGIKKAGSDVLFGSGLLLQITNLGGKEIIPPVIIKDGFYQPTIEQLLREIEKSSSKCE